MAAATTGQCAATSVAAVTAEGLFYVGVAALWLLIIQWDLLDRLLGGPDLNGPQTVPNAEEIALVAASARQVLEDASDPTDAPANDGDAPSIGEVSGELPATVPSAAYDVPPPSRAEALSAADLNLERASGSSQRSQKRRMPWRSRPQEVDAGSIGVSEIGPAADRNHRSLYQLLPRALPRPDMSVRRYVNRKAERLSSRLLPELGTHLGIEAGLAGLATAVPSGIRDCGVRAVDRLESMLRRWAAFGGGVLVLYRILLWRTGWPFHTGC